MCYTTLEVISMSDEFNIDDIVTINNFLTGISLLFQTETTSKDEMNLSLSSKVIVPNIKLEIPMHDVKAKLKSVRERVKIIDATSVYDTINHSYEKIVERSISCEKSNSTSTDDTNEQICHTLHYSNGDLQTRIGKASSEMLLYYLCYIGYRQQNINLHCALIEETELTTIEDFCSFFTFDSIQIHKTSAEPIDLKYISFYIYMFLYVLARKHNKIYVDRLTKIDCIMPSNEDVFDYEIKDCYLELQLKEDPVRYYLQAFCVNHPAMRFLSFYHVLEFQYSSIQERTAVNEIQLLLQEKTVDKDLVRTLYKNAASYASKNSEREQLLLCLFQNIPDTDLPLLFDRIQEIGGEKALSFYANQDVSYATGKATIIDRNQTNLLNNKGKTLKTAYEYTIEKMAERIYAIRNFFVHSKENDERKKSDERYIPFEHDELLSKELPLIQAVSELFIEKYSVTRKFLTLL